MERRDAAGAGIPPKFALLYAVGHFYGDYVVQQFLERNHDWAVYAWGDWKCLCGKLHIKRATYGEVQDMRCNQCTHPPKIYVETDLFNPAKTVVGHADLIFKVDDNYYVYEFKSIERADIVFTDITAPLGDHLAQASNYYYMLKAEGKNVSNIIRFVYIDRSMAGLYTTLPFREVAGKAIPARRLRKFYLRSKKVRRSIKRGILPERKCESIECSRAKQCTVAISCFSRKKSNIKRIPLDWTQALPRLESTAAQSITRTGTVGRSKVRTKKVTTPRE